MSAEVILAVELLDVDDFRSDGPHLQQVQLAVLDGPLNILILTEHGTYPLSSLVEQPNLTLRKQIIRARTVAFAGDFIAMGTDLTRHQTFPLPAHRFNQDGRAIVRTGREKHACLVAVYHLLNHDVHPSLTQGKMLSIISDPMGVKRGNALPNTLHEMRAVDEQTCFILTGIGGHGPVLVRCRGAHRHLFRLQCIEGLADRCLVNFIDFGYHKTARYVKMVSDQQVQSLRFSSHKRIILLRQLPQLIYLHLLISFKTL